MSQPLGDSERPAPANGPQFIPWLLFSLTTIGLVVLLITGPLAAGDKPRLLLVFLASAAGLLWASSLAAALSTSRPTLGPRGLTLLAIVGILLSNVLMIETRQSRPAAAFAGPFWEPAPYVMFHARPGLRVERPGDVLSHGRETGIITVNSLGFRGPEWPQEKKGRDELRVAFLGGSVVFNGVTDDRTIAATFGRGLERRLPGTRVTVLNAGLLSANSTQEMVLLQSQVVDFDPDIVVALDGFNDIWMPLYYDERVGYPFNFRAVEDAWRAYEEQENLLEWVRRRSRSIQFVLSPFTASPDRPNRRSLIDRGDSPELQSLPDRALTVMMNNWMKIASVCDARGLACVLALQPTLLYRRAARGSEASYLPAALVHRTVSDFYGRAERAISDAATDGAFKRATAISLAGIFENYPAEAYWDSVHPFDEGNAVIASRLVDEICSVALRPNLNCR